MCATSSGSPYRRNATWRWAYLLFISDGIASVIPVLIGPGQMQLTVIPSLPSSTAKLRVSPVTPDFDAEYADKVGVATIDSVDATLTIRPDEDCFKCGRAARTR